MLKMLSIKDKPWWSEETFSTAFLACQPGGGRAQTVRTGSQVRKLE